MKEITYINKTGLVVRIRCTLQLRLAYQSFVPLRPTTPNNPVRCRRKKGEMWRIYVLLRREGFRDNHKRMHRIYKEEGLNLRSRRNSEEATLFAIF